MIAGFAWKKKLGAGAPFTNIVDPRSLVYPVSTLIILEPIISTLTMRTLTLRTLTMLRRSTCRQGERSAGDRARC